MQREVRVGIAGCDKSFYIVYFPFVIFVSNKTMMGMIVMVRMLDAGGQKSVNEFSNKV